MMLSAEDFAWKVRLISDVVREAAASGKVPGAVALGHTWFAPEQAWREWYYSRLEEEIRVMTDAELHSELQGRPLHVPIRTNLLAWKALTVVRVDTRPWKWSADFRQKKCFCNVDHED